MNNRTKTNIHLDTEITGASPDAQYDYYNTSDGKADFDYSMAKFLDLLSGLRGSAYTSVILTGGAVTDGGSGTVNIGETYAIGKDINGDIRPVYYPGASAVAIPSGWDDGRNIWVVLKQEFIVTGSTRNHAAFPAQSYHPRVIDSFKGNVDSTLLFVDSAPASGEVVLRKFTMTGTTFVDLGSPSDPVSLALQGTLIVQGIDRSVPQFGGIVGGLVFNTSALPPKIKAGSYDVLGETVRFQADQALALTDAFGASSQVLADYSYSYIKILLNKSGQKKFILSYDKTIVAALLNISVSGISVLSGTATLTVDSTTGLAPGHVIIVPDSNIGYLHAKVVTVPDGTHITCKTSAADDSYSGGTYSAYYRIATYHGPGSLTGVNTDANIPIYSPSPNFNPVYNGYYRSATGEIVEDNTAEWRDIGFAYIDASGNVTEIHSYKSGEDKDDNEFDISNATNNKGSTNTNVVEFDGTFYKLWGDGYTFIKDSSLGDSWKLNDSMWISGTYCFPELSDSMSVYCKTGLSITNSITGEAGDLGLSFSTSASVLPPLPIDGRVPKNYYMWIASNGIMSGSSVNSRIRGKFFK